MLFGEPLGAPRPTSLRIAADTVLRRPDDDAPVSNLFLFSRKQDLAFEQPVGDSPRQRHHVRFWRWDKLYEDRTAWIGAATFDQSVGLSHTTGQVTHHIAPDVDASVTSSQTNSIRRRWCSQSNGTTASTTSVKGAMAAVMLGTPMVA